MTSRRRRWVTVATLGAIAFTLLLAVLIALAGRVSFSSELVRQKVAATLADRLEADVELGEITVRFFPRVRVKGTRLEIRHQRRRDVPPLISVATFTVDADLVGLWRKRIHRVDLTGLDIQIPPRREWPDGSRVDDEGPTAEPKPPVSNRSAPIRDFIVSELVADDAKLTIIPRRADKRPKVWEMHELHLENVGVGREMPFHTILTNAVPPGRIDTAGSFGPWQAEEPGFTPINGQFTFERADLGFFKGIGGILSAHGTYGGALARIEVHGETETPDFTVTVGGHPVPLSTKYHAIVDGTNGDTALERIDVRFLETSLVARGGVFDVEGVSGRLVTLDVDMEQGRLEDVMLLAVKTPKPPMTGALHLETKFELPPGDKDVVEKLRLDGRFGIRQGRFTNPEVQRKIVELSRRASVKKKDAPAAPSVASDVSGRFTLANGTLALPAVTFDVPGAAVRLAGRYGLETETIAFAGDLFMDAKISQTTTGWKSLLLKVVDPIFRRDGRTVIPIKISGTRNAPSFGLDVKRVFNRDDPKDQRAPTGARKG
jgi:hypothetical protein